MLPRLSPNQRLAYRQMIEETLSNKGDIEFLTSGSSMRYMLTDGDTVVVRGCQMADFHFGDVVLLKNRKQENRIYIVHRIIGISTANGKVHLATKGDSSPKDYFSFDTEACLGKVITFSHGGQKYSLQRNIWFVLNPVIALMSRWVSRFSEQAARRGKKKQVLAQRVLHSLIKRLLKLGMFLSRDN